MTPGHYTEAGHDGLVLRLWECSHCGCIVYDQELHDRVNGLDLRNAGNMAMTEQVRRVGEPLEPPEPTA